MWKLAAAIFTVTMALAMLSAGTPSSPTPQFLAQDKWVPESNGLGLQVAFALPNAYSIEMNGPGGTKCSGKFLVAAGKVQLQQGSTDHNGSVNCKPRTCGLVQDSKSLFRTQKLDCGSLSAWRLSSIVPAGQTRTIDGLPVKTMGLKEATLLTSMRVRARPNAKAKAYSYKPMGEEKALSSLPEGHTVIVIASTQREETISGKKAYWYFVDINFGDDVAAESNTGWVFGGWMKF